MLLAKRPITFSWITFGTAELATPACTDYEPFEHDIKHDFVLFWLTFQARPHSGPLPLLLSEQLSLQQLASVLLPLPALDLEALEVCFSHRFALCIDTCLWHEERSLYRHPQLLNECSTTRGRVTSFGPCAEGYTLFVHCSGIQHSRGFRRHYLCVRYGDKQKLDPAHINEEE